MMLRCGAIFLCFSPCAALAQVATDGSVGPAIVLNGQSIEITETLGARRGDNLFHSFQDFNVSAGQEVTFTGDATIQNVISRVTGGDASKINGALRSKVGTSDFYLVNPSGVMIGAGVEIDMPGAFHVTDADRLIFVDGTEMATGDALDSSLSISAPEAFGFLSSSPGVSLADAVIGGGMGGDFEIIASAVEIMESDLFLSRGNLRLEGVGVGTAFLAGGDSEGVGGLVTIGDTIVTVTAGGGALIRGAVIQGADVDVELNDLGAGAGQGLGAFAMSGSTIMLTDSDFDLFAFGEAENGVLTMDGGAIQLIRSTVGTATSGASEGGDIAVFGDSLFMTGGSFLSAGTFGEARSGDVSVDVGYLSLTGGGIINNSLAEGNAGAINIVARDVDLTEASINSETFAIGSGFGGSGDISITADNLLVNASSITNSNDTDSLSGFIDLTIAESLVIDVGTVASESGGGADAGVITIRAGDMMVRNGGLVSSSVLPSGAADFDVTDGAAGAIFITANSLTMDGGFNERTAIETQSFSDGPAGSIGINAAEVSLDGLANINSSTGSAGEGGLVRVDAGTISLTNGAKILSSTTGSGNAGGVGLFFDTLTVKSSIFETSRVSSDSDSDGEGGLVALAGRVIDVSERGLISVDNSGAGAGGALIVTAEMLRISSNGALTAITQGDGAGGFIAIESTAVEMDTGLISSSTRGGGLGGGVDIQAGTVDLVASDILSDAEGLGNGGDVVITADTLTLVGVGEDISLIATDNLARVPDQPSGAAGRIGITAGELTLLNGGAISSNTQGAAPAGSVDIIADTLRIVTEAGAEGSEITSETFGDGDGGLITIESDRLEVVSGVITSSTTASGDGGGIQVTTGVLDMQNGMLLSDTSGTGDAGFITINAGGVFLTGVEEGTSLIASDNLADTPDQPSGIAGNIDITARDVGLFDGGRITSNTRGAGNAGGISVAADRIVVSGAEDAQRSLISSDTSGDGDGGFINLDADLLLVTGFSRVSSDSRGNGDGGFIQLTFGQARIDDGAFVSTGAFAAGDAGAVGLEGAGLVMREGTLSSASDAEATGDAGSIFLDASTYRIVNSDVSSDTEGVGNGGRVSIIGDELVAKGTGDDTTSISAETGGAGDGGAIDIEVDRIRVVNAAISTTASDAGSGGVIEIDANTINVLAEGDFFGSISADSNGAGDGGLIRIRANALRVFDGGLISTDASGTGAAGDVRINSDLVAVRFGPEFASEIGSSSFGDGDGGEVRIRAQNVILTDGGRISSDSTSAGAGGLVDLRSRRLFIEEGIITSEASGDGPGGDVFIVTRAARIVDKNGADPAGVSTQSTERPNEAGSIEFTARTLEIDGGDITTSSEVGSGGLVSVTTRRQLRLTDGGIETSVAAGGEDGGDIIVIGGLIILGEDGTILANADAGDGGDMDIIMRALFRTRGTDIRARSELGIDGQIAIDGLQNPDTAEVADLPVDFLDANAVLNNPCLSALLDKSQLILGGETFVASQPDPAGASSLLGGLLDGDGAPVSLSLDPAAHACEDAQ